MKRVLDAAGCTVGLSQKNAADLTRIIFMPGYPALQEKRQDKGKHQACDGADGAGNEMVPVEGIEPPTFGLQNRCSTAELNRRKA
jgi:hypothetical protein